MSGHDESAILAGMSGEGETGIYERSISCDRCGYRNRRHGMHFDSAMVSGPVNGLDGGGVGLSGHDESAILAGASAEGGTGMWGCPKGRKRVGE